MNERLFDSSVKSKYHWRSSLELKVNIKEIKFKEVSLIAFSHLVEKSELPDKAKVIEYALVHWSRVAQGISLGKKLVYEENSITFAADFPVAATWRIQDFPVQIIPDGNDVFPVSFSFSDQAIDVLESIKKMHGYSFISQALVEALRFFHYSLWRVKPRDPEFGAVFYLEGSEGKIEEKLPFPFWHNTGIKVEEVP